MRGARRGASAKASVEAISPAIANFWVFMEGLRRGERLHTSSNKLLSAAWRSVAARSPDFSRLFTVRSGPRGGSRAAYRRFTAAIARSVGWAEVEQQQGDVGGGHVAVSVEVVGAVGAGAEVEQHQAEVGGVDDAVEVEVAEC